uniref:Integrase, catalytic region, zinc finger, CCHC-type, peptidase aspartic, catalytic n=1 Tax=Tanacetum cinerariifolium TaxID=118510 RepID=A0A6L2J3Y3_TANCI|nr:integrase, catalytic region, zinc finger, CCHC-type, peptidase aspartic, catalytic [Tanacetum cinerariifolium]
MKGNMENDITASDHSVKARSVLARYVWRAHMFLEVAHICSNDIDEKAQRAHMFMEWRSYVSKNLMRKTKRAYMFFEDENLGKLQLKADIGIFIGYAPTKKAFRIYNQRTRRIVETIHVDFDELTTMASEQSSSGPALDDMTLGNITSEVIAPIAEVIPQVDADSTGSPFATTVDQDAPSPSKSLTPTEIQSSVIFQVVGMITWIWK